MGSERQKVVLAYSGGLDTSVILKWLIEEKGLEVIAFVADVGQEEDLEAIQKKAYATGASKVYVADVKEEFAQNFAFPILRANAVYEGGYFLGTSIARPLIAKEQLVVAHKEGATYVSHGATGKGNDQVRFELTYYALDPRIKVIAPWREWDLTSRTRLLEYAKAYNIPISLTAGKAYSIDKNLLHVSYEAGELEDPWQEPNEAMFSLTVSLEQAPELPASVIIAFEGGNPVAVDGKRLSPYNLIQTLNRLGGAHGVGRADMVENRFIGMKSRGVYESPGMALLHAAKRALEGLTMDREVMHLRDGLIPKYAELVYNGFWFAPEREALQVFFDHTQKDVTGEVRLKLFKGGVHVVGRRSEKALYDPKIATFEGVEGFEPKDSEGFIRIHALRLKIRALRMGTPGA
jgi:argininosuccinate synthase